MKRIKELRTAKKITQQALADVLHVTQQSVFKYEHDLAVPDVDILIACANYFETTVDYLVGNTDDPHRYTRPDATALTPGELRALQYYRRLSPKLQELIQGLIANADPEAPAPEETDLTD